MQIENLKSITLIIGILDIVKLQVHESQKVGNLCYLFSYNSRNYHEDDKSSTGKTTCHGSGYTLLKLVLL